MASSVECMTLAENSVGSTMDWTALGVSVKAPCYCSGCGAASWKSCICLRSADPESEEEIEPRKQVDISSGLKEELDLDTNSNILSKPEVGDTLGYGQTLSLEQHANHDMSNRRELVKFDEPAEEMTYNLDEMMDEVGKIQMTLENLRKDKASMKQSIADSCLTFLHDLKSLKKKIVNHLDSLEKKAKAELNQLYETHDKAVNSDLNLYDIKAEYLQQMRDQLKTLKFQKDIDYDAYKDMARKLSEAKDTVDSLCQSKTLPKLDFVFHPVLQSFTTEVENFCQFMVPYSPPTKERTLTQGIDVNIQHCNDANPCRISGICQLKNGQILLSDKQNQNIKALDTEYNMKDCCQLDATPNSICSFGNNRAAIALSNNTIQFVSLDDHLRLDRTMELDHDAWGIACSDDKLYVSDMGKRVFIYDTRGNLMNTVYKDHLGQKIFTNSRHIAVSADSHCVYVCDKARGLIKLDENGRFLSVLSHSDLKMCHGVCVDQSGQVYMSGSLSHNIVCFIEKSRNRQHRTDEASGSKSNQHKKENDTGVVISSDAVSYPGAMCFDRVKHNILVASYPPFGGSDSLKIFTL